LLNDTDVYSNIPSPLLEVSRYSQSKFTVPFDRDPNFVGRKDVIREISIRFETQSRVALCCIGGIG